MARILVVDDEPSTLKSVARQLARWGHTTFCADSAKSAAAVLASDQIDVLVSDLQMPGMDGLALAAMIHATSPAMPVIIMSGSFEKVGAMEPEGIALIPKSGLPGALRAAIERAVAGLRACATP